MYKRFNRRDFIKRAGIGIAVTSFTGYLSGKNGQKSSEKRPNLIFIMADDLGFGDLGCYGQKLIQTPVLDRMSKKGLRFTRFYAGFTVCLPSRCTLMTGLHTGHCRCRVNGGGGKHPELEEEDTTIATVLKAAGYRSAMVGKWSLGDNFRGCAVNSKNKDGGGAIYKHGWDFYFGEPNQTFNHTYYPDVLYRYDRYGMVGKKTEETVLEQVKLEGNSKKHHTYSHDLLTKNALAFIDAAKDETFFLYLPYTIPHKNYQVPELEPYAEESSWKKDEKVYASMITRMDRDIGSILDRLKKHGIDKKTLVIFTSDNGPSLSFIKRFNSNGELEGNKGSLKDGGIRVPFIAYWPGTISGNCESDYLGAFWDIMPTFAELAGIQPPEPIDGISIVPTLLDKGEQKQHNYLFFRSGEKSKKGKRKKSKGKKGKKDKQKEKKTRIIRGEGENRSDEEIMKEAVTDVIVPVFKS